MVGGKYRSPFRYGQNVLSAQAYNLTDDAGPAGTPTTVIYKPPYTPPEPSTNTPPRLQQQLHKHRLHLQS